MVNGDHGKTHFWNNKIKKKIESMQLNGKRYTTIYMSLYGISNLEDISKKIQGEELFMLSYEVSHNFKLSFKDNKIHIILELVNLDKHFLIYIIELLSKLIEKLNLNGKN